MESDIGQADAQTGVYAIQLQTPAGRDLGSYRTGITK